MSRHYHDSDCVADAMESVVDRLDDLIDRLDRLAAIYEMSTLTDEQRHQLRVEREAVPA
jgi:truncated hemoglobin YjbI